MICVRIVKIVLVFFLLVFFYILFCLTMYFIVTNTTVFCDLRKFVPNVFVGTRKGLIEDSRRFV